MPSQKSDRTTTRVPRRARERRAPRRVVPHLAVAAVVALLAGCTPGGPRSSPSTPAFGRCGPDGQGRCTSVSVPQDWDQPNGEQLKLGVMVLPAQTDRPAADPLFYLAGGPGAAATLEAPSAGQIFEELNWSRDLVFVDQRGTGRSSPQTCPSAVEDFQLDPEALRAAVHDCLASASRDPRHDTTPSAVRDLDAVRAALGYAQVNLYGVSYGVSLGLAYLQRYDTRVRSAVLDSGSLLDFPLWQTVPTSAQQSFNQLSGRCAADPVCAAAYQPAADLAAVVDALRAQPVRVTVGGHPLSIDLPSFVNLLIDSYLAQPKTAVLLPGDLHALAGGEWSAVLEKRVAGGQLTASQPVPMMRLTVVCGDAWARVDPAGVDEQTGSLFAPATAARAAWQAAVCAEWPHDAGVAGPVHTSVPVVFLNGTADPVDPPANVAAAPRAMPNARLVAVPGGHAVVTLGCLPHEIAAFVEAGRVTDPGSWTSCTRTLAAQLPPFPPPS